MLHSASVLTVNIACTKLEFRLKPCHAVIAVGYLIANKCVLNNCMR